MFGDQSVRLIRENWGGVIEPDVNGNLIERGATRLAEELYAMFNDDIPQTQNAPLTVNKTNPDAPGLTINNSAGGNSLTINGGNTDLNGGNFTFNNPAGNFNVTGSNLTFGGNTINFGNGSGPAILPPPLAPLPPPMLFFPPPFTLNFADPATGGTQTLPEVIARGGGPGGDGGGTTSFLGRVVSGSGDTYRVALYGNGPDAGATATVTATVPQIDAGETIPAGTWIDCVHAFAQGASGDNPSRSYAFQPPVWLGTGT